MEKAFQEYGTPELSILFECEKDYLETTEKFFISLYNSVDTGLNSQKSSVGCGAYQQGEEAPRAEHKNDMYIKVFKALLIPGKTFKTISLELDISYNIVANISSGQSHKWLEAEFPEEYKKLVEMRKTRKSFSHTLKARQIKSPEGSIFEVNNLSQFSREHSLDKGTLGKVLQGINKQHKGWTLP
jgi:hypothetical protein